MRRVTVVNGYNGQERNIEYNSADNFFEGCTEMFRGDIEGTINLAYDDHGEPIPTNDLSSIVNGSRVYVKSSTHYIDRHYNLQNEKNPDTNFTNEEVRMINLGAPAVGKSAVTFRYINQNFIHDYDPTIEDAYKTSKTIDGVHVHLSVLDTQGIDDYRADIATMIEDMEAIVLIFDVTTESSWEILAGTFTTMNKDGLLAGKIISVLGNKSDMPHRDLEAEKATVNTWCENDNIDIDFRVGSAKTNEQISECFVQMIRQQLYINYRAIKKPPPGCSCVII